MTAQAVFETAVENQVDEIRDELLKNLNLNLKKKKNILLSNLTKYLVLRH